MKNLLEYELQPYTNLFKYIKFDSIVSYYFITNVVIEVDISRHSRMCIM